jgi:hypothetical protein
VERRLRDRRICCSTLIEFNQRKEPEIAVAVIVDPPNGNEQRYEQVSATIFPDGKLPEGWLLHLAGPIEGGWRVVNVVPSQEEFEAFARDRLRPAFEQAGEADIVPQLSFFPVHKLIET